MARKREPGVTIEQIAKDFGVHPMTLQKWLSRAEIDDGAKPGQTRTEAAELREARKRIRLLEQEVEVLRRGVSLAGQPAGKRLYPLVSELAVDGIPIAVACRVLKLARQPYYRWLADPITDAEQVQARRANALFDAHRDDPELGYRFPLDEARDVGQAMADRMAWRICRDNGWWSEFGKKKGGKGRRPGPPVHDDRVLRDLAAQAPNQLWLSDITEHRTAEGKLYLCAVKDVLSNRIVDYSISDRVKARLAVNAVNNAAAQRGDVAGCVFHTDRGSQFRARKQVRALNRHDLVGSMGRVGAAGDNAVMESFFSLLQKNVLDRRSWQTRQELRIAIVTWIERTYHRPRGQKRLSGLAPVEYEAIMNTDVALAA